jgi:hypothetical protein
MTHPYTFILHSSFIQIPPPIQGTDGSASFGIPTDLNKIRARMAYVTHFDVSAFVGE